MLEAGDPQNSSFLNQKPLITTALSVGGRMQYQAERRDKRKATFYLVKSLEEQSSGSAQGCGHRKHSSAGPIRAQGT